MEITKMGQYLHRRLHIPKAVLITINIYLCPVVGFEILPSTLLLLNMINLFSFHIPHLLYYISLANLDNLTRIIFIIFSDIPKAAHLSTNIYYMTTGRNKY